MAYLIEPEREPVEVRPANGRAFKLIELQRFVCGYIEIIHSNDPTFLVCINEEGKLRELRRNDVATRMVRERIPLSDYIVGNAVIGTAQEFGE